MKKIICLLAIIFSFGILNITPSYSSTLPIYDETFNNNQGAIYANGTPIVVSESNGNTLVTWEGGSQIVPNTVSIFGGGNSGTYNSSSIIMNGGTVQNIVGGGIGYTLESSSEVNSTNIVINGGTITNAVVGGGFFYSKTDISNIELNGGNVLSLQGGGIATGTINGKNYSVGTADDSINSPNRVNSANVTINDGTITFLLFGGGQGYSYTGTANIVINGGNMNSAYVTAGGSNGYTGTGNVKINGGSIGVYQSVNRGTVDNVNVELVDGYVDRFYVGGETEDSTVNGSLKNVNANLIKGTIGTLNPGTSNSTPITIDNDIYSVISTDDIKVTNDNIGSSKVKVNYEFEVSPNELILFTNKKYQLNLKIRTIPENHERAFEEAISYKSENPEIATVSEDGTVTGVRKGTTNIIVTVGNKTDSINVVVHDSTSFIVILFIITLIVLAIFLVILALL